MKKITLLIALFFSVTTMVNAQNTIETPEEEETTDEIILVEDEPEIVLDWQVNFKQALLKAKAEKKPLLIYFTGSDWCGPCIQLRGMLFNTEEFKEFSDEKMVLYKADFPRNTDLVSPENRATNKELAIRYAQTSFPTMILVNERGEVLGRKDGVYMADYYYQFIKEALSRHR